MLLLVGGKRGVISGIVLLLCVREFESHRNVIWMVFLGLSIGAIGELMTAIQLSGDVKAALIKACASIGICLAMEGGRIYFAKLDGVKDEV